MLRVCNSNVNATETASSFAPVAVLHFIISSNNMDARAIAPRTVSAENLPAVQRKSTN